MSSFEVITYAMKMAEERGKNPTDDIVTQLIQADIDGEKLSGRVRLLRHHARGGRQRDLAQLDHQRDDRLRRTPTSGSCSRRTGRRPPSTRSSVGPHRFRRSSAPPARTPSCPGSRSRRASGW
jgi:hypothetical protein